MAVHEPESRYDLKTLLQRRGWLEGLAFSLVEKEDELVPELARGRRPVLASDVEGSRGLRDWAKSSAERAKWLRRVGEERAAYFRKDNWPQSPDDDDLRRLLARTVVGLGDPHRTIVLLKYFSGLPVGEVARQMGIKPSLVPQELDRAHRVLRGRIQRKLGSELSLGAQLLPLLLRRGPARWAAALIATRARIAVTLTVVLLLLAAVLLRAGVV